MMISNCVKYDNMTESARKIVIPKYFQVLLEVLGNFDLKDRSARPFLIPILHRCIHEWDDVVHLINIDESFFTITTELIDKSIESSDEELLGHVLSLMYLVSQLQVFRKMIIHLPLFDRIIQSKHLPPDVCVDIAVSLCRDDFVMMELAKGNRFEMFVNSFLLERIDGEVSRLENQNLRKTTEKILKAIRRVIHRSLSSSPLDRQVFRKNNTIIRPHLLVFFAFFCHLIETWKDHILDIPGLVFHLVVFSGTLHEHELIYLLSTSIMTQMMSEDRAQMVFSSQCQSTVGLDNWLDKVLKICRKPLESWARFKSDKSFVSHVQQDVLFGIAHWAVNDRTVFSLIHKWDEEELFLSLLESTSWTRESLARRKSFARNPSLSVASISGFSDSSSDAMMSSDRSTLSRGESSEERQELVLERFTELLEQNMRQDRFEDDR
jgi:hypothetical protein